MSCKVILVVVITAKDPALGSSHKRLINISLRVVGRLEYQHNQLFATPAMGNRFLKIKKDATELIRMFIHVKKLSGKLSPGLDRKPSAA